MSELSVYDEAQLLLAAIRILEYKKSASPSFKDISDLLGMTIDRVSRVSFELNELGIIDMVDGPFDTVNLQVADCLKAEDLPRTVKKTSMEDEIKKFQMKSKNAYEKKVEEFTEESKKKEQALFEELEKKLKSEVKK